MQILHSALQQPVAQCGTLGQRQKLFASVAGGDGEGLVQLRRDTGAATVGKPLRTFPAGDRQDAGNDRSGDPGLLAGVAEAKEGVSVEEELGDGRRGPGVDLALEPGHIGRAVGGIGVGFGIGTDADGERAGPRQRFNKLH